MGTERVFQHWRLVEPAGIELATSLHAMQALSQLSFYGPTQLESAEF